VGFEPTISAGERPQTYALENKLFERKIISALREERGTIFLGTSESGVVFEVR
jgi:hypothetical protein